MAKNILYTPIRFHFLLVLTWMNHPQTYGLSFDLVLLCANLPLFPPTILWLMQSFGIAAQTAKCMYTSKKGEAMMCTYSVESTTYSQRLTNIKSNLPTLWITLILCSKAYFFLEIKSANLIRENCDMVWWWCDMFLNYSAKCIFNPEANYCAISVFLLLTITIFLPIVQSYKVKAQSLQYWVQLKRSMLSLSWQIDRSSTIYKFLWKAKLFLYMTFTNSKGILFASRSREVTMIISQSDCAKQTFLIQK